jgi:transposase
MEDNFEYVKRSQRDFSMSLKLQIVGQIEQGELSATSAQQKTVFKDVPR